MSRPATSYTAPRPQRRQLSRVPYLPGLDGLRALAVVGVMIYHANHEWLGGGFLGVEVFFVISGYLITLLLVGEDERKGFVDLAQFWLRRARRLLPALCLLLLGLAVYMTLFQPDPMGRTRGDFVAGLLYASNWYQIFVGQGYTASGAFAPLRHLWSLAVEEQFYLLWPLIMVGILRRWRRRLPQVGLWLFGVSLLIATVVAVLYRSGDIATTCSSDNMNGYWQLFGRCISADDALYLSTVTRAGGILLGAGFAMLWRPLAIVRGPLKDRSAQLDLVGLLGIGLIGLLMWRIYLTEPGTNFGIRYDPWLFRGGFLWVSIATLMAIAAVTHQASHLGKFLGNPVLNWIGTRSYGLYLYHWPIYQAIRKYAGVGLTLNQFVLAMAITLPITELSYRFVETPIRTGRLSEWWRSRHDVRRRSGPASPLDSRRPIYAVSVVVLALVGYSVFRVATAPDKCSGDVECQLEAGAATTSTTSSESTAVSPTDVTGSTIAPTTVEQTTTTTAPPPPLAAFGESVMLGAANQLRAGGFEVDAQENRQADAMVADIEQAAAKGRIGQIVVVQVGTNGTVTDKQIAAIVAAMPEGTSLYFMTVKADQPWITPNNDKIRAIPTQHPNVGVIDWEQQSAEIAGELSKSDGGAHLRTTKAMQFYANLIFEGIGKSELVVPVDITSTTG
ncbi:MAG: acyltransferase family protein [Ilumatobacteraceae bacterium]